MCDVGVKCADRVSSRTHSGALTRAKMHRYLAARPTGEEFVRSFFQLAAVMVIAAALHTPAAYAQSDAAYLVTYVDVLPTAIAPATALLKKYRDASFHQDGNLREEVLQELERPNRFAIVEAWRDKAALDSHAHSPATTEFRDKLKAIQAAPYDERVNTALYVAQGNSESRGGALYVITHVDVIPPGKDDCMAALKAMSTDTAADPGNISYEVLQQANRGNHFSVLEAWTNRKMLDGHAEAAHTRDFRAKLTPVAGALYDERIYKAL
jgi:quinol monooxygenase YgiN